MIKKIFLSAAVVLGLFFAFEAHAFTLQNNAQCTGGTLIKDYADVQDTGANIAAKALAQADCAWLSTGPGQCCEVTYRRATPRPPAIGSHVFSYSLYQGGTVVPSTPPAGTLTSSFQHWAGISGGGVATTPAAITASLVANPSSIENGESSLLTWSSTGATTCTGNFPTNGATSGSVSVSPSATTEYAVTCTDGPVSGGGGSCLADGEEVPAGHLCSEDRTISPPLSSITWDQCCSKVARVRCPAPNEPAEAYCSRSGSGAAGGTTTNTSGTPVQSAVASATVMVSDGTFQASCRAHPTRAGVGEDVLWSSTVSGPRGTYSYSWSGTDGLSGTTNQVFKKYSSTGRKTAMLSVTYTPGGQVAPPPSSATCTYVPKGEPYFTKVCSGGSNSANIQQPQCDDIPNFPSGGPSDVGKVCKQSAECDPSPIDNPTDISGATPSTYYGMVQNYVCGTPVTPAGTVQPQSGTATEPPLYLRYWNTLTNFLLFDRTDQQFDANYVETVQMIEGTVQGATASIVQHTEGEMFTSAPVKADMLANGGVAFTETTFVGRTLASDQVTMDRVCTVLHGAGSTATQIGARGYNSCKNNGIIRFASGKWESVSGCAGAHISGSFSCIVPAAPTSGTCALTITPSTVVAGESATLSWTSTGVTSLTIDRGIGSVAASGSMIITPTTSGTYSATGSSQSSTNTSLVSHTETDAYTNTAVIADLQVSGTAVGPGIGFAAEKISMDRVCADIHGSGSTAGTWGARSYNSPGNNYVVRFNGTSWSRVGAKSFNSHLSASFTCNVSQAVSGPSVQCAAGTVTVTQPVIQEPITKTVQCDNAVTIGNAECSDGIDNDQDGLADADDPQCLTGSGDDGNGDGTYDPNGNSESGDRGATQCSDGIDNNGDGNADWPDDPGCSSADDNLEFVEPSELTLTASPPLIKKNQQCTITVSARNVASCTLSGTGVSRAFTVVNGVISSSEVVTPGLTQTSTYTLSCRGLDGKTATKKVDCKIAPTFEEI